ncbi:MAG: ribose-phosphate diphosphokinase [Myxococcota bacterium]|nr:ribose-phosphate diphosphokinase [Myxococcota bacterium]
MTEPLVFSTSAYTYLAKDISDGTGWELGTIARKTFPDGEHYLRIDTAPSDRDIIIVGGTIDDANTLELYDLACGCVGGGAYRLRLVIPYYGYSTMERSVRAGEVVTAKTRARLLSSIPMASRGTQVFMLDLHVDSIAHYFEGGVRTIHVYGKHLVIDAARRLAGNDFVLGSTDAGRAKWVESLAKDLGVNPAFVYKRRTSGDTTEITGVSAQVQGKRVVIYDDMIRTGGSLLDAAKAYRDAGATSIDAIATHGLFPGTSLDKLRSSGLLGNIVTTDSHPRAVALQDEFLQVASTAKLLIEHLKINR